MRPVSLRNRPSLSVVDADGDGESFSSCVVRARGVVMWAGVAGEGIRDNGKAALGSLTAGDVWVESLTGVQHR
jgi:hypothetical protein